MYLEQITIENFRIFKKLNLKLNKGLNILVGENNSGKTALIDAIRYTLGTNSSERHYINDTDFHQQSNSLSIQLKFTDVDNHAHIFIEHLSYEDNPTDSNQKNPCLYVQLTAQITNQERRGYPYIRTEIKSGKDGNGLMLESEVRDFLSSTYLKPLRDAESELSAGRGSRLAQILASSNELKQDDVMDSILEIIKKANSSLINNNAITATSENIEKSYLHKLIFNEDKDKLKAIIDIACQINKDSSNSDKRRQLRSILERLNLSLSNDSIKHGLGYNNLLFMATELLLLEQDAQTEYPLLLIEEPEAHLHPQLQNKLLDFINSKSQSNNIPAILTTHSPNISSKTSPKNIIMMHQGKAFPLRPEDTELEDKNYQYLEKFLDATKANLFFAKGIILVEGYSENILIPTIAKLLGRPLEDYGVSIINVGNKGGWKHFIKIFSKIDNPIKIAVLEDVDLWPPQAEEKEEHNFGFKTKNTRNKSYWLETENTNDWDTTIKNKQKQSQSNFGGNNVKILLSDRCSLEYCLAWAGLFDECAEILNVSADDKAKATDNELKGLCIQKHVENKKSNMAFELAITLENKYLDKKKELKSKLPPYIINAIEYVTESLSDEDSE